MTQTAPATTNRTSMATRSPAASTTWAALRADLLHPRPLVLFLIAVAACAVSTVVASIAQGQAMPSVLGVDSVPVDELVVFLTSNSSPAPLISALFVLIWNGSHVDSGVLARQALICQRRSQLLVVVLVPTIIRAMAFASVSWLVVIGWLYVAGHGSAVAAATLWGMLAAGAVASLLWSLLALAALLALQSRAWALITVLCWFVVLEPLLAGFGETGGSTLAGSLLPGSAVQTITTALADIDQPILLASTTQSMAYLAAAATLVWGVAAVVISTLALHRRPL